jgi:hypothetical protein
MKRHTEGAKHEWGRNVLELWEMVACDLDSSMLDACSASDVDTCAEFVVDQCFLQLGVRCDLVLVRSLLAHVCPHILGPSRATAILFCMSGVMEDVVGKLGAVRLRSLLVRSLLRIAGDPGEIDVVDSLQDSPTVKRVYGWHVNCGCKLKRPITI